MTVRLIFSIIFVLPFLNCQSQTLIGTWKWKNEKYQGEALFDSNTVVNTIYFLNTSCKVLEKHQYYLLEKNRLYLSDNPISTDIDKKSLEVLKVKEKGPGEIEVAGSTHDHYKKVSDKLVVNKKQKEKEFYQINSVTKCYDSGGAREMAGLCLCIAGINFYDDLESVYTKLGKPFRSNINPDNSISYFFIVSPKEKKPPYLGVTVKDQKIIKLELAGYKSNDDASFSSIRLGDFYTFVKQRLGEPAYKKEVKAPGDETWVYLPIPITIEFRLNKVTSITIEPFQLEK